jgi:hypothetical protein
MLHIQKLTCHGLCFGMLVLMFVATEKIQNEQRKGAPRVIIYCSQLNMFVFQVHAGGNLYVQTVSPCASCQRALSRQKAYAYATFSLRVPMILIASSHSGCECMFLFPAHIQFLTYILLIVAEFSSLMYCTVIGCKVQYSSLQVRTSPGILGVLVASRLILQYQSYFTVT